MPGLSALATRCRPAQIMECEGREFIVRNDATDRLAEGMPGEGGDAFELAGKYG